MTDPTSSSSSIPRDAKTIQSILSHMGISTYDPRVVNQLLELLYRYVSSIILDARQLADHADRPAVEPDDIRLAIRTRNRFVFTQPPPRDVVMRMSQERNCTPLPPLSMKAGVALPPRDLMITAPNYDIVIENRKRSRPDAASLQHSPKRHATASANEQSPVKSPHASKNASPVRSQTPLATPKPGGDVMIIDPPSTSKQPSPANTTQRPPVLPSPSQASPAKSAAPRSFQLDPPAPPR